MLTIASWNVNGVRAALEHGMLKWLDEAKPDVLCIQETKAQPDQLPASLLEPRGYRTLWASAARKGYSGVAAFVRAEPVAVTPLGVLEHDCEGRVQILRFPQVTIVNTYFPNSQDAGARLDYKLGFCEALLERCNRLRADGQNLVICGDYNIAHQPIDLKNPKANENNAGYLPEERAWMDKFLAAGYVDTFRMFCPDPGHYTWWTYRFQARKKDIGWRLDYHCVNTEFRSAVAESTILKTVMGSDHCPVLLRLRV
ncbi:MAG: exodeoxyribonuclease III [Lentisphaerae bacterium RIFOXYB12_FULL_65_16]|nr:MAG: exodeoxyribonuclease III [Lentisphaerae bacterium RIFOXYA12_64_32]OGV84808.1 MAG: exodeoxyribonuclease III [Lentisphaerae bacterium RIFOXYB12_FULL_65_16]